MEVLINTGCVWMKRRDPYVLAGDRMTGRRIQDEVENDASADKMEDGGWRLAVAGCYGGDSGGGGDSLIRWKQMDEVSLRLPTECARQGVHNDPALTHSTLLSHRGGLEERVQPWHPPHRPLRKTTSSHVLGIASFGRRIMIPTNQSHVSRRRPRAHGPDGWVDTLTAIKTPQKVRPVPRS